MNPLYIKNIYEDLKELSDPAIQEDRWHNPASRRISSYIELMCTLFDDHGFDQFIDQEIQELGASEWMENSLRELRDLLNAYEPFSDTASRVIIDDPPWLFIGKKAKKIIERWEFGSQMLIEGDCEQGNI